MTSVKTSSRFKIYFFWIALSGILTILLIANLRVSQTIKKLSEEAVSSTPPVERTSDPSAIVRPELNGIYKGSLPCADCEGITETLILAENGSYILEDIYRGKSAKPARTQGKWSLVNSNVLKLSPGDASQPNFFQVSDSGELQMLDSDMKKIDSPFNQILKKQ